MKPPAIIYPDVYSPNFVAKPELLRAMRRDVWWMSLMVFALGSLGCVPTGGIPGSLARRFCERRHFRVVGPSEINRITQCEPKRHGITRQ